MIFDIIIDKQAQHFLESLDKKTARRIFDKIIISKTDPFNYFIRLSGRDDYKLRVGDYRIIADIDSSSKKIKITLIGLIKFKWIDIYSMDFSIFNQFFQFFFIYIKYKLFLDFYF